MGRDKGKNMGKDNEGKNEKNNADAPGFALERKLIFLIARHIQSDPV